MSDLADKKYPEQITYLRENHGFSQAHANALVMFSRGSNSSRRFSTPTEFFKTLTPTQSKTAKAIFKAITAKFPDLELVIAWNQPMLKMGGDYVFGLTAATNHLLIAPWSKDVLETLAPKLKNYEVNKKTIRLPNDWDVDEKLLQSIVRARLAEVKL